MKYLAQINIKTQYGADGGCYKFQADSLDDIREWSKSIGKPGDELMVMRNGDKIGNARKFTI